MKRVIIWLDIEDKHHEEMLHKVKSLLSVIDAKYTIVDVLNVSDQDYHGQ
jgi:hypothetical protein